MQQLPPLSRGGRARAVPPDYKRPDVAIPAAYRFGTAESVEVVNTVWWERFQDPVLEDLSQFSKLFNGPARIWSYAGSLTVPIFTAGSIRSRVKRAEVQINPTSVIPTVTDQPQ